MEKTFNNFLYMSIAKKYPLLGSSADPEKIALSVKGYALAVIPVIVMIAGFAGVDLTQNELTELLNAVLGVVSSICIVYGLGRKIYLKFVK